MTKIDWLVEEINKQKAWACPFMLAPIIEEAKELHKKKHGETWDAALNAYEKRGNVYIRAWEDYDDYYIEKFKK